jgi:hypothetical protein
VRAHEVWDVCRTSGPTADFRTQCAGLPVWRDKEITKFETSFETRLRTLQDKLKREERELKSDETDLSQRKMEETGTHLENIASVLGFGRKRTLTTSLTKRRQTAQAKADVEESLTALKKSRSRLLPLRKKGKWIDRSTSAGAKDARITEITVTPLKKDVLLDFFGVAWMPFHVIKTGDALEELPGFSAG